MGCHLLVFWGRTINDEYSLRRCVAFQRLLGLLVTVLLCGWPIYAKAQATPQATAATQPATNSASKADAAANTREAKRVKVNFFINSISNVNDETGTYDVDFWLDLFWNDPLLNGKTIDQVDKTKLWDPQIDLVNSRSHTILFQGFDNSLEPDTNVRLSYRFVATFFNKFELHRFPFDHQTFVIKLESALYDSSFVLFDLLTLEQAPPHSEKAFAQAIPMGKYIANDVAIEGWTLNDAKIVQQNRLLSYDKSTWAQFRVELTGSRLSGAYLWRIFLILAFIMLLGWVVFLVDLNELRYRLLLLFTLLLAAVTFNFTMVQILPKLTYLTLVDRYLIFCYGLLAVSTVGVLLTQLIAGIGSKALAARLNSLLLILYPLLFIAVQVVSYWSAAS